MCSRYLHGCLPSFQELFGRKTANLLFEDRTKLTDFFYIFRENVKRRISLADLAGNGLSPIVVKFCLHLKKEILYLCTRTGTGAVPLTYIPIVPDLFGFSSAEPLYFLALNSKNLVP